MKYIAKSSLLIASFTAGSALYASSAAADPKPISKPVAEAQIQTVPKGTTTFNVKLKGYVFGLRVMKANISGGVSKDAYSVRADLFTSGIGAFMKKFQIWATTTGYIDDNGLRPATHIQQNLDKKNRRVEMNYAKDTVKVSIVPRLGSLGKPPATEKQKFESDDTLSAVLNLMMRGFKFTGEPCVGTIPVFDSKQHYLLRLEQAGTRRIKQKGFKGDTVRCHVYYEAISGYDPEDLPSTEEAAAPVTVYLAKHDDAGLYIPVRMVYKISMFKAVIKAREITITKH